MKGDFTRNTFDLNNLFSRVLMQQGRVTLDADFNEQIDILLHYLQTLARDIIGPYAAPSEDPGFRISGDKDGILIGAGRYYVDGILVENKKACLYSEQPHFSVADDDPLLTITDKNDSDQWYWLYLDVWERYLTSIEREGIREAALGGPDTCSRTQYVWQVKALPFDPEESGYSPYYYLDNFRNRYYGESEGFDCEGPLSGLDNVSQVQLAARVDPGKKNLDACITSPDSKYVGVENHLYRVEIHRGGKAGKATFKWSRDNGSVVTPWLDTKSSGEKSIDLTVTSTRGFSAGCWVELTDEDDDLHERPGVLAQVVKVGSGVLSVDSAIPGDGLPDRTKLKHPKVRRWDQTEKGDIELDEGAIKVVESPLGNNVNNVEWIDLEDGIQIAFAQMPLSTGKKYRTGDYWLIPARVATGAIEWPPGQDPEKMSLVAPRGVVHHYAPLAFALWKDGSFEFKSCQCEFEPINSCFEKRAYKGFGEQNLLIRGDKLKEEKVGPEADRTEFPSSPGEVEAPAAVTSKRSRTRKRPQ